MAELKALGDVDLATYLYETGLELEDVYRNSRCWAQLRAEAGFGPPVEGPDAKRLVSAVGRLLHVDDLERIDTWRQVLSAGSPPQVDGGDVRFERLLTMLHFSLWGVQASIGSLADGLERLWACEPIRVELVELLGVLAERMTHVGAALGLPLPVPADAARPLRAGRDPGRLRHRLAEKPPSVREGVKWDEASQTDLFFVTLNKSERDYYPAPSTATTRCRRSCSTGSPRAPPASSSPTGQRYLNQRENGTNIVLFVREQKSGPLARHRIWPSDLAPS